MNWIEHYKAVKHRIAVEAPMKQGKLEVKPATVTIAPPVIVFPKKEVTADDILVKGVYPKRYIPVLLPLLRTYMIPFEELQSDRRFKRYQLPRFHMYSTMREAGYSLSEIGRVFCRDHTTIMHGIQRWKEINGG